MELMSNVLKIECIHQHDVALNEDNTWNGYILSERNRVCPANPINNIEGCLVSGNMNDKRKYLLGLNGINLENGMVSFTLFDEKSYPLDYILEYDEEDSCFYGSWYFVLPNYENVLGGYTKINITESFDVNSNLVLNDINDYGYNNFYKLNSHFIANLIRENKPNIRKNIKCNFSEAKSYFHDEKVKQLVNN